MIVMKFGGTSVGNAEKIKNASNIIKSRIEEKPIVVVSAVAKITDMLIELANQASQGKGDNILNKIKEIHVNIIKELELEESILIEDLNDLSNFFTEAKNKEFNAKSFDKFQSYGERMSSKIVAAQLNKIGIKSEAFNAYDIGFLTNSNFGSAEPLEITYSNLKKNIGEIDAVPVITGFLGKTEQGEITTIGRGGSDYTGAIVGSAINAKEIQIWTDVNGIMSTDPRVVEGAKTIDNVSFAEASELAYFGARVLHPKTILPALDKNIPVRVLNSWKPENKGTVILNNGNKSKQVVKAIAHKKNITLINIKSTRMLGAYGFLSKLFSIFDKYKKSVDVISTSEVSVSLTIDNDGNMNNILNELKSIADAEVKKNKATICVVGEGMRNSLDVSGRIFTVMSKNNINVEMISMGASEINITFIVEANDAEKAVKELHKEFYGI